MLELHEGREGAGGIIYKVGGASGSDDGHERPKLIDRLMEIAKEWNIERLFLAPVGSEGKNLKDDTEYRLCPNCGKYWLVTENDGRSAKICDVCHPPSRCAE